MIFINSVGQAHPKAETTCSTKAPDIVLELHLLRFLQRNKTHILFCSLRRQNDLR